MRLAFSFWMSACCFLLPGFWLGDGCIHFFSLTLADSWSASTFSFPFFFFFSRERKRKGSRFVWPRHWWHWVCLLGREVCFQGGFLSCISCFLRQLSRTEWPLVLLSQSLVLWGYLLLSLLEMGPSQVIFFSFSELATALPVSNYSGGSSLWKRDLLIWHARQLLT